MFFLCILFLVRLCHLGLHNNIIMNAIVLGKHVRRTSFIQPKPSSLLAATPYRVIPCNFLLLFYSSIYSVYSWFFLINLKTGIGQSKYCLRQPFSLFDQSLMQSFGLFKILFLTQLCFIHRRRESSIFLLQVKTWLIFFRQPSVDKMKIAIITYV